MQDSKGIQGLDPVFGRKFTRRDVHFCKSVSTEMNTFGEKGACHEKGYIFLKFYCTDFQPIAKYIAFRPFSTWLCIVLFRKS
jgi:hypothetical protein